MDIENSNILYVLHKKKININNFTRNYFLSLHHKLYEVMQTMSNEMHKIGITKLYKIYKHQG